MTKKKDSSRFDNLFSAAREPKQTTTSETPPEAAPTPEPTKKSKSSDPNYMRTTVYLPKQIHRRLKSAAADEEKEISEVVEELVKNWLASRENI